MSSGRKKIVHTEPSRPCYEFWSLSSGQCVATDEFSVMFTWTYKSTIDKREAVMDPGEGLGGYCDRPSKA